MEKIALVDETFDPFRSESYNLSVQISMVGYKICVIDTVRDCVISLITSPFEIALSDRDDWSKIVTELFTQHEMLARKFKNVYLSFESPIFTIVPTFLFVPEKAKQVLDLVHQLPDLFEVRYNSIKELKATVVYAIPSSLASKWIQKQPRTIFVGHTTPLVTMCALVKTNKDEPIISTYFSHGFFIQAVAKNNELITCNSFTLFDTNDTAYHLLNTCKVLGFDPNKLEILLKGNYQKVDGLESILDQYFRKVNKDSLLDKHNFSYAIAKYKSIHWNLFNLALCE